MNDFRRTKRRKPGHTVDVTDAMTETVIGHIGNLSESGMLLIVGAGMLDDALYQLRFKLHDGSRSQQLDIGVHQLWSDGATAPGQFWAGYRFIDVSPQDAEFLRGWIEAPGGHYV